MYSLLKGTWSLLLGILLIQVGNGMQSTVLGIRGLYEGFDAQSMGFIMSGYFIGFLGSSQIAPKLLRQVGHVRVFAAFGSICSAAFILYPVIVNPWIWFLLRLVIGFCLAGLYIVSESWLNDVSTNKTRGKLLSIYLMMQMIGIIIGQVLINIASPEGFHLFIIMSILVSLSFTPVLLTINSAPVVKETKSLSIKELYKVSPLGVVGVFLLGSIFAALFGMVSVYATAVGFSVKQIAIYVMVIYLGGMLMQYPVGWLSDKMDRRLLVLLLASMCCVSCFAVYAYSSTFLIWFAGFMCGATANPLYTLLVAYTNDHLENSQMTAASSGLIFVNGVGAMSGPIIVGYMMEILGSNGYFLFISLITGFIAMYCLFRMWRREGVEDTAPYVIMAAPSRVSPYAVEYATEHALDEIKANDESSTDGVPHKENNG